MRIEAIRLRNFKASQNFEMRDIPPFCVIVGANGTGKSTLFDVFRFLKHCLLHNVRKAVSDRGGFQELVSRGHESETIEIEIKFRMDIAGVNRLVTYFLEIAEENRQIIVRREILEYKRSEYGSPYHFLDFENGAGLAVTNEQDFNKADKDLDREPQTLQSKDILAIKGLGQFERFRAASAFRRLIENWHISDFHIEGARGRKEMIGDDQHVSESGDNLHNVARRLHEIYPEIFKKICTTMEDCVPGIAKVETQETEDGMLLLKFGDRSFSRPFIDRYVSDGTIKMFAYLLLLHDPEPHPVLCVEEPENQLYPSLLEALAEEFEGYSRRGGQVFVSTHAPELLNAVDIRSVFWLKKENGYTRAFRAEDDAQLVAFMNEGDKMGRLWQQGLFKGANPQ